MPDGGSSDGSQKYAESRHPGVKAVRLENDPGFAKASNMAAKGAADSKMAGSRISLLKMMENTKYRTAGIGGGLRNVQRNPRPSSRAAF